MKVLVTGRGTSGSWQIRGVQLGKAIGATVAPNATKIKGFDLCVVVKRADASLLQRIRASGVPIVYDVLDAWPQRTGGNDWDREKCLEWLRAQIGAIRPHAIVAATQAMADDCKEFGKPVLWLPHHARPGQKVNPVRERVKVVGYEGSEKHLGKWRAVLDDECSRRGWSFKVNPTQLADLDIVVALREATGYAARFWKSGVKLANAQSSGTPCIIGTELGCLETATGGEFFVLARNELSYCLDALTDVETRISASAKLLAGTITLESVAEKYRGWLETIRS